MITTQDLNEAAAASVRGLAIMINADWSKPAGDLEWTCRRTVDHISDALMFYSVQLATRASVRVARARSGDAGADIGGLLGAIEGTAAILGRLGDEAGHAVRAFHPAGQADTEGFIAMGCDEILIHSYDVASGLGAEFKADDDLAARLIARLFPWAPSGYPT
ncbi:MAG: VOC family protein, partial [Acidimicrobiia bacterium]|nr:VOC family protein [Acidimicrobiia bacterium]